MKEFGYTVKYLCVFVVLVVWFVSVFLPEEIPVSEKFTFLVGASWNSNGQWPNSQKILFYCSKITALLLHLILFLNPALVATSLT